GGVLSGSAAKATGYDSIAIGSGALANAGNGQQAAMAIGKQAQATGPNAFALGSNAHAEHAGIAFGSGADASGGGLALGHATSTGPMMNSDIPNSNVAIGQAAKVTSGSFNVALGATSVASNANLTNSAYDPSGQGSI